MWAISQLLKWINTSARNSACRVGVTIDQSRIDTFASCTGDQQWIHVDVERAQRESPYGGPVAHGYLTLSMVAPLSMQIGILPKDSSAGLNYGIDKVRPSQSADQQKSVLYNRTYQSGWTGHVYLQCGEAAGKLVA